MAVRDYTAGTVIASDRPNQSPALFVIEHVYRRSITLRSACGRRTNVMLDTAMPLARALFGYRIATFREHREFVAG